MVKSSSNPNISKRLQNVFRRRRKSIETRNFDQSFPQQNHDNVGIINKGGGKPEGMVDNEHDDKLNYALLIALYTLQGIPMGLSASIPFLIQQKVKTLMATAASAAAATSSTAAGAAGVSAATSSSILSQEASRLSYNANAIFALCSWPFSLKLLWAPIVDAIYMKQFGRRKTWLVPVQIVASLLMIFGSNFVESQLGLNLDSNDLPVDSTSSGNSDATNMVIAAIKNVSDDDINNNSRTNKNVVIATAADGLRRRLSSIFSSSSSSAKSTAVTSGDMNVKGLTIFFFILYFLMATQDIAVDGWALTMLSKKNRGKGPVCNSIGQNLGYFLSFVGFLALNDIEASEKYYRPILRYFNKNLSPTGSLVSLGSFIKFMGFFMFLVTTIVALFKHEEAITTKNNINNSNNSKVAIFDSNSKDSDEDICFVDDDDEDDRELDASEIGLKETYHRLWAVCQLPSVRWLFVILLTYRLPTSLGDNVKFLKAVEFGLSKSTTALLNPTIILPLGIVVPIIASKIWHGHPLKQFMTAYKVRVTLVPILDMLMLWSIKEERTLHHSHGMLIYWIIIMLSTALQSTVNSLQFNAQMTFFASRVDPAIGGSYMTLLNTAANLGGTWPSSVVMYLIGHFTVPAFSKSCADNEEICKGVNSIDSYYSLQIIFSILGLIWIFVLGGRVHKIAALPDDAWRTHLLDDDDDKSLNDDGSVGDSVRKRKALKSLLSFGGGSSTTDYEKMESVDLEADDDLLVNTTATEMKSIPSSPRKKR